jgi:hypothetical protein
MRLSDLTRAVAMIMDGLLTKSFGVNLETFIQIFMDYLCKCNADKARVDIFRRELTTILWREDLLGTIMTDPKKVQFGRDVTVMSQESYIYNRRMFEIDNIVNGMPTILAAKKEMDAEVSLKFGQEKLQASGIIGWYLEPEKAVGWLKENVQLPKDTKEMFLNVSLDGFGVTKSKPMVVGTLNPIVDGVAQLPLVTLPVVIAVAKENEETTRHILNALAPKLDELAKKGIDGITVTLVFCADMKAVYNTSKIFKFTKRSQRIQDHNELNSPTLTPERKAEIVKAAKVYRKTSSKSFKIHSKYRLLPLL